MGHRLKDDGKKWPVGKIYYDYKLPDTSTAAGGQQQLEFDRLKLVDTIEECMERWMRFVNADDITHIQFIAEPHELHYPRVYRLEGGIPAPRDERMLALQVVRLRQETRIGGAQRLGGAEPWKLCLQLRR